MVASVTISSADLAVLRAAAAADPHREVCGLLLGTDDVVAAVVPCANVARDPATRFEIDPAALLAAHRRSRIGSAPVMGCYHSHPRGPATPSARDAADAAPDGQVWLILGRGADVTAWRAVPTGALHGRFDRLSLHCAAGAATTAS